MFRDWFSHEPLLWYLNSAYKQRIDQVGRGLLQKHYLPVVIRQHLHEGVRFLHYLEEHTLPFPSSVHDSDVQRYLKMRFPVGSASRLRCIRAAVRVVIDIDDNGDFCRRTHAPPPVTNTLYRQAVPAFLDFLQQHRGVSAKTISKRAFQLNRFTDYLKHLGLTAWNDVQAPDLRSFLVTRLTTQSPATRMCYASAIRSFYHWAYLQGVVDNDLAAAAVTVRQYRLVGIPEILTDDEVVALLQSVDRSTAIGKRDYAVLLLAARYGLRPGNISQLSLDHINWRDQYIALTQSKTGRLLLLPLLPEVSGALIDYLRHGRPQTTFRNIFVRHLAPHEPFGPNNNLPTIFQGALRRAGLEPAHVRKGLYLFRHTLASQLLQTGSSLKTIGDVLGHACLNSTLVYTKVDLSHLKTVALSLQELLP
jgi:site-specific recombinase XerD